MSEKRISVRTYWLTWIALMILTGTTWGLSYVNIGVADLTVALGIAAIKATLVSLFFMHLIKSEFGYRFVLLIGIFFFLIMVSFDMIDLLARGNPGITPPLRGLNAPR